VNDKRVDEETGQRRRFRSVILPPYARRSPRVTEVLPLLYLHGLSTKDFVPALAEYFGTEAGLSASAILDLEVLQTGLLFGQASGQLGEAPDEAGSEATVGEGTVQPVESLHPAQMVTMHAAS
jgi:hypothetical protein